MNYTLDYYQILGVSSKASKEDMKAAYRQQVKLHHPDKNHGDQNASERFRKVQEAYEVLSNDISRHVYDEYRAAGKTKATEQVANSRTYAKTSKVWREKRIYVFGRLRVKYHATPEPVESHMGGREQTYTIWPTETMIVIESSGVFKDGVSREYEQAYLSAELFAAPIGQPVRCRLKGGAANEYYDLEIHDLKIKDPVIENSTRHEQDSFGELIGDAYGYVIHRFEEEVTELHTEYFGTTGEVQTKQDGGIYFTRQQQYTKDGARYWGEWSAGKPWSSAGKSSTQSKSTTSPVQTQVDEPVLKYAAWVIYLLLALIFWPKLIVSLLFIAAIIWLLVLVGKCTSHISAAVPWLPGLVFALLLGVGIYSLVHPIMPVAKYQTTKYQPVDTRRELVGTNNDDTLITHLVQWSDYDSNQYTIQLAILQSAVSRAHSAHHAMSAASATSNSIGWIYAQLQKMDTGKLKFVYNAFDSIVTANKLNEFQASKMIVSCIQSIPYYLIVDQSCSNDYQDEFITNYLRRCKGDCCLGNVRFGVQSPAEFIGDLKGDCDTRALLLFDILARRGTEVALLTSAYYKHALIAVHPENDSLFSGISVPVNGKNYYLWETTSSGHSPGEIPPAISNLQYWNVSLLNY